MRLDSLQRLINNSSVKELNPHLVAAPKTKGKKLKTFNTNTIEKNWIYNQVVLYCKANNLTLELEKKFHPERKWRFDFFIKEWNVAVEYEGIFSRKSRHTTVSGFSKDAEKYNEASLMGYTLFRYTALTYKKVILDLENFKMKNNLSVNT